MSKQFIVDRHTTPGTPALDPVATAKVPVYDTLADAEADLANLSVGQIVATKDTGDELAQPVDVVESGNLHAVSSNAVAESLSYSTTEQKTGGKWIDGKPIYRKVIEDTFTSGTNTITHNLSIDNYIKVEIFIRTSSTLQNTKGYFNEQNRIVAGSLATNNFNVTTNGWIGNGYIILEYTKTTD